jgi:uncharacterized membrane protein AbrB (regulator of aidB expression)
MSQVKFSVGDRPIEVVKFFRFWTLIIWAIGTGSTLALASINQSSENLMWSLAFITLLLPIILVFRAMMNYVTKKEAEQEQE